MKTKIAIAVVALLAAFAAGRYLTPEKIQIVTQTVTAEKKTDVTNTDDKKNTVTVVHEVRSPNGIVDTTTTTTVSDKRDTSSRSTDSKSESTMVDKTITTSSSKVTVSALAGAKIVDPGVNPLVYGVSLTKPILGPITVGVWGLSNSTIGASIGLTF